jgi:hypothetical protein
MPRLRLGAAHGDHMLLTYALVTALAVAQSDTIPVLTPLSGAVEQPVGIGAPAAPVIQVADDTVPSRRRKAVEVSDAYAVRLKIHYIASYATLPIFAAQAIVGEQLYNAESKGLAAPAGMRGMHDAIAVALGGLFAVNTVTGAWNWWDTRSQEKGRTWRTIHSALMLVADAGFAYTATLGKNARGVQSARDLHRNWAEGSAGVALASYIMMWKPFRRD